ncbi:hypothetical protein [Frankia canadensis]|uniref:hypothetical protein n=1 Tax=Frankia canadensis TaxID=1836972 RepID=UPI001056B744|nr:hypothetical protein [Frankia canadensis]
MALEVARAVAGGPPATARALRHAVFVRHIWMRRELLPGLRAARDRDAATLRELMDSAAGECPGHGLAAERPAWPAGESPLGGLASARSAGAGEPARRLWELSTTLVRRVEREAAGWGAAELGLWTDTRLAGADRLLRRLGYAATGRSRDLREFSAATEIEFRRALSVAAVPRRAADGLIGRIG